MKNNKKVGCNMNTGIGFFGLLTILFIAFKFLGVIEWSWIWVLSPLWISGAIVIALTIIITFIKAL